MIDLKLIEAQLATRLLESCDFEFAPDGQMLRMNIRFQPGPASAAQAGSRLEEPAPTDPASPIFRSVKMQMEQMYAHSGAQISDEEVLGYMKSQGF